MAIFSCLGHFEISPAASSDGAKPNTQELLAALRRFLSELQSEDQVDHQFVATLRRVVLGRFQEDADVRVRLSIARAWPRELSASTAGNLLRVLDEALNNAQVHGRASDISVRLQPAGNLLEIVVTDNGSAANQLGESRFRGVGTLGLRDRVNALGGELLVESGPGASNRVRIRFPA
jgi:signal transduction histidine kinase